MRRIISCALLLSLLAFCGCNPNPKTAPKRIGWDCRGVEYENVISDKLYNLPLFGDIESVTITEFDVKMSNGGVLVKDQDKRKEEYYFNQNGNVTKFFSYDAFARNIICKIVYEYNSDGKLVKDGCYNYDEESWEEPYDWSERFYKYDSSGNLATINEKLENERTVTDYTTAKIHFKYDSEGRLVEKKSRHNNIGDSYRVGRNIDIYEYDVHGYLVKAESSWNDGISRERRISSYNYDATGRMIEKMYYGNNSEGKFKDTYQYQYDSMGNLIEEVCCDSDGKLYDKHLFKYDSSGNLIEKARYYKGTKLTYYTKWDSKGNEIEKAYYKDNGGLDYKYTYQYNSKGNIVKEIRYGSDGNPSYKYLYKYKYDSKGNLIRQEKYYDKNSGSVIEYKIFYRK